MDTENSGWSDDSFCVGKQLIMQRWVLALISLISFATGADAFILSRNTATTSIASMLAVYTGCTQPPSAPSSYATSKTWYFDVANGHPPAYYSANSVPQANWGDVNHPFDNPEAIWGQFSIGGVPSDLPGWGATFGPSGTQAGTPNNLHVLAGLGYYETTPGHIVVQDYANYTSLVAGDTNHFRLWPGDTVLLRGDTNGDAFPAFTLNGSGGNNRTTANVDGSGNTKWVWIKNDPAFPAPNINNLSVQNAQGDILQGVNLYQQFDWTSLTQTGLGAITAGSGGTVSTIITGVPLTGGSGSGAIAELTLNSSGGVTGVSLTSGGTGYANGDTLSAAANTGNYPTIGALSGFSIAVIAPNTTLGGTFIPIQQAASNGQTLTIGLNTSGTTKVWTFGGGANTIPNPSPTSIVDTISNMVATLNADPTTAAAVSLSAGGPITGINWKVGSGSTTLVHVINNPTNGNTFVVNGITYTWITGASSGANINIATTLQGSLTNALAQIPINDPTVTVSQSSSTAVNVNSVIPGLAGVFLVTSTLTIANLDVVGIPLPLTFLRNTAVIANIKGGVMAIDWTVTSSGANFTQAYSNNPSNGNTITVNGTVYTWVTGTPTGNQIAIGATLDASLANGVTKIATQAGVSNVTAGCVSGSNCLAGQTKDLIFDSDNVSSWGPGHAFTPTGALGFPVNDYPSTQSLGINVNTGVHGGWGHTYWNVADWQMLTDFGGINIEGIKNPSDSGTQPIWGLSCVAVTNTYIHHTSTLGVEQAKQVLIQNVAQNYNVSDAYDSYVDHDITWNRVSTYNAVNSLIGVHPDGIQFSGFFGSFTFGEGLWFNIQVTNSQFVSDIDPFLADTTEQITGLDGLTYDLTQEQSGLNETSLPMSNMTVANNVFYSNACEAFSFGDVQDSIFANNSVMYKGSDNAAGAGCGTMLINHTSGGSTSQSGNTIINNVAVGMNSGYTAANACANNTTWADNWVIPAYYGGISPSNTGMLQSGPYGKGFVCNETTSIGYGANQLTNTNSELGPIQQQQISPVVGGSGGNNGTITGVPLTGGSGTGAIATLTIAAGAVTGVTITTPGTGYKGGDILSAAANSGNAPTTGALTGFSTTLYGTFGGGGVIVRLGPHTSVTGGATCVNSWFSAAALGGAISGTTIVNGGSGCTTAPAATISGVGTGANTTTTISGGALNSITITSGGSKFPPTPVIAGNYFAAYTPCDTPFNFLADNCPFSAQSQLNAQPPGYPASTGPLVGAGTSAGAQTTNIDGKPWPNGNPNIGAY